MKIMKIQFSRFSPRSRFFDFKFSISNSVNGGWTITITISAFTSMSFSSPLRNKRKREVQWCDLWWLWRPSWSMPLRQSCNICTATYNNQCRINRINPPRSWCLGTISHKTYPNKIEYVTSYIFNQKTFSSPPLWLYQLKCLSEWPSDSQHSQAYAISFDENSWHWTCPRGLLKVVLVWLGWLMTHGIIEWSNLSTSHSIMSYHIPSQPIGSSPAVQTCPHHLVLDQSLVLVRRTVRQSSHKMSFVPYILAIY